MIDATKQVDPRRQAWAPYIRKIADLMSLKDWRFEVYDDEPEGKDALACVYTTFGRKFAGIDLSHRFLGETPEKQRHVVVHELLHAHFNPAFEMGLEHVPEAAKSTFRRLFEHGIDGTADALAPLLPLPGQGHNEG